MNWRKTAPKKAGYDLPTGNYAGCRIIYLAAKGEVLLRAVPATESWLLTNVYRRHRAQGIREGGSVMYVHRKAVRRIFIDHRPGGLSAKQSSHLPLLWV